MEQKREFKSGATSTKQPRLSLIPHGGLVNAAIRFELGLERHGEKAWNNLSANQSALQDKDFLIERLSHCIEHSYSLIDKLKNLDQSVTAALGDAGAIAWCGLVLGEALTRHGSQLCSETIPEESRRVTSKSKRATRKK